MAILNNRIGYYKTYLRNVFNKNKTICPIIALDKY
jgi:hypothetical protein